MKKAAKEVSTVIQLRKDPTYRSWYCQYYTRLQGLEPIVFYLHVGSERTSWSVMLTHQYQVDHGREHLGEG